MVGARGGQRGGFFYMLKTPVAAGAWSLIWTCARGHLAGKFTPGYKTKQSQDQPKEYATLSGSEELIPLYKGTSHYPEEK